MIDLFIYLTISLYVIVKIILDIYQILYIRNATISAEELDLFSVDLDYFNKSNSYNISKLYLSIASMLITSLLIVYFIFFEGILNFSKNIENINIFNIDKELMLVIVFVIVISIINIPVGLYKTFYIEDKYGFNKNSLSLYTRDFLLSLLLSMIIVAVLFSIFNFLFQTYPDSWWLYIWAVYIIFNMIILYAYPTIIAPMFNSFKKLSDAKILTIIKTLSDKTKFNISDVYVMDGSKRSTHSNAYFTGFYKSKRIVFFDTLLDMLTPDEVQAVLAHEIGHYKKNHILKSMILSLALSLLGFYLIYQVTLFSSFFNQLNINSNSAAELIIFFSFALPSILFFLNPIFSSFSRKNEFEADNYAKEFSNKYDLISSLKKLYKENLTLFKTSPIYSRIYNSHPTVFERINNLKS